MYASRPAAGTAGALYFPTDGPVHFVDDGAAWRPVIPGGVLGGEMLSADWTASDASVTPTFGQGVLRISRSGGVGPVSIGHLIRGAYDSAKSYVMHYKLPVYTLTGRHYAPGFVLRSAGGALRHLALYPQGTAAYYGEWTNTSTRTALSLPAAPYTQSTDLWIKLRVSGGNFILSSSFVADQWCDVLTAAVGGFVATEVGIALPSDDQANLFYVDSWREV